MNKFQLIIKNLIECYYLIMLIIYGLVFFILDLRPSLLLIFLSALIFSAFVFLKKQVNYDFHKFFFFIILPIIFSSLNFLSLGFSIGILFKGIVMSLVFISFAFFPFHTNSEKFFLNYLIFICLNIVFGSYFFYTKPDFYMNYWINQDSGSYLQIINLGSAGRLITLFGSIETGFLSAIGFIISINLLFKKLRFYYFLPLLITLLGVILSQQRAPLVIILLTIIYFLYLKLFKARRINFLLLLPIFLAPFFIYLIWSYYRPVAALYFLQRFLNIFLNFSDLFSGRFERLEILNEYTSVELIFGRGLGLYSFFANEVHNELVIYDAGYGNLIAEIGIFGFLIIFFIYMLAFFRGVAYYQKSFIPLLILLAFMITMVGTTLNYYSQILPIVYYSIGRLFTISNPEVKKC